LRRGENLLTIRDLLGNEEILTDYKELTLNRKVNGEKSISLTILPTVHNAHSFPLVEEESILEFDGEEYVIKKMQERNIGNTYIKRVDAIHKFYVDLINKQQPIIHNGSITFTNYMQRVFEGTGYTFSLIDSFTAQSFENLGNDNRLSLLQKGLERYKAEMELVGNDVRFKKQVGNDSDFQFRYGHNIKTIERNVDTTNLATVIRGKGAPLNEEGTEHITAYHRSPNADIFGEIDAPPVEDERFSTKDSLEAEMKARLQDTPEFSITIDFVDLRAAGYPWTVPNEGDRVFVIYEPMNDLIIETRILEINEVYDANGTVIKTDVTLANYKKTFAGTMFNNLDKRLKDIVNDDGVVKYSVLDEAVRGATEALQSAQTELEFNNGIIAREKDNPNKLVLLNSAGLGVSTDGGNQFKTAITADGVVAERIVGGAIIGVNLASANQSGIFHVNGADAEFINTSNGRNVKINPDGLFGYNSNGDVRFKADQTLVTSSAFGTSVENVYLAAFGEIRAVNYNDIPGDGQVGSYRYLPVRGDGFYGNFLDITTGVNLYIRPYSNGEVRVTNAGTTNSYRPLRASNLFADSVDVNSGTSIYMRPKADGSAHITATGTTDTYRPIYASEHNNGSSITYKTNIEPLTLSGLEIINNLEVKQYILQSDVDNGIYHNWQVGLISEVSPEVATPDGKAINLYKLLSYTVKAVQELSQLEQRVKDLETVV
jgi:phage minor structural protein